MYCNFQASYYGKVSEPLLNNRTFVNDHMLVVVDCSKRNDSLENTPNRNNRITPKNENSWKQVYFSPIDEVMKSYIPTIVRMAYAIQFLTSLS